MSRFKISLLFIALINIYFNHLNAFSFNQFQAINEIEKIPLEDYQEIKSLFKCLFFEETFSYCLLGDKPMGISTFIFDRISSLDLLKLVALEGYFLNMLIPYCQPSSLKKKQWELWCKYKHKFIFKKFLLFQKKIGTQIRIVFVNKDAFLNIVNQNLKLFQRMIGVDLTAEGLLEDIKKESLNLFTSLNNHESLFGILLGFGTHNSMLFEKKEKRLKLLNNYLVKSEIFQKETQVLNNQLQCFHNYNYTIPMINRIGFMCEHDHPETIQLRSKYNELDKKINAFQENGNWFEKICMQLTS